MNWLELEHQTCIVTGGAKGLGAGITRAFINNGARVLVLDHDPNAVNAITAELRHTDAVLAMAVDVTNESAVDAALAAATQQWERAPSVLVNNAAITSPGPLADVPLDAWERQLHINLGGYLKMARAFHRHSTPNTARSIVNIASISGKNAQPQSGGYSMSKAAIRMLTQQLCLEWGPEGIRANTVSPGLFITPLSERFYQNPDDKARREQVVPLRRIGHIDELAQAVLFLASPKASYVNGAEIVVDGGFSHSLMTHIPRPYSDKERA